MEKSVDGVLRGQQGRPQLKEKFVAVLEAVVMRGEDPSQGRGDAFWDEVLLLKVNGACVSRCVNSVSEEMLQRQGALILALLSACSRVARDKDAMRSTNALAIVSIFLRSVFRKRFANFGFDVLNTVGGGFEAGDEWFRQMIDAVVGLLRADSGAAESTIDVSCDFLMILATGCENMAANSLIEYLHREAVFEALVGRVAALNPRVSESTLLKALVLVAVLCNYQKYETRNVFVARLAALEAPEMFSGTASLLCASLKRCRVAILKDPATAGSGGNAGGNAAKESGSANHWRNELGGTLLCCYEFFYLSKDFAARSFLAAQGIAWNDKSLTKNTIPAQPCHFRALLEMSSLLSLNVRDERSALHCKMALLALIPVLEDRRFLTWLHGSQLAFAAPVALARKTDNSAISGNLNDLDIPPICWVLDMLLEFTKNNIHSNLQVRLHTLVLQCIHRILCFQKSNQMCVKRFKWEALWKQLFRLCGFVAKEEWFKRSEVVELIQMNFTIFNLFITYGDLFLPSGNDYDFLYYELIRESKTINALQVLIDNHCADSVLALHSENISAIVAHFKSRIDLYTKQNDTVALSPDEVLSVIKRNYGSLKLTLLDNLDVFLPYSENPAQVSFFRQYIRVLVADLRAANQ